MTYRRLKDGSYAVGFKVDGRFITYTSAFDAREAKALVKAFHALLDLFHATSGAWVTMVGVEELPRGSSNKKKPVAKSRTVKRSKT